MNTTKSTISYCSWGEDIEPEAHRQMQEACSLAVSVKAALMPDAHVGYGLPIGGVLGTRAAVIPYAVGVDIACRVMVSILDLPLKSIQQAPDKFKRALEEQTVFGTGGQWKNRKFHAVLDQDWGVTEVTKRLKEKAWSQLGTSGSGNHFVEFGEIELFEECNQVPIGKYLAVVSHSGSRGAGAQVAAHYTQLAKQKCNVLPKQLQNLAWLEMANEGQEYWAAMELMGQYASANHHLIHQGLKKAVGAKSLTQIENHHNFAWKELHDGEELIVHRKGATPAGKGELGYIPGSMLAPGFLVQGQGEPTSLNSASHGAGRKMSRRKARDSITRSSVKKLLSEAGIEVLSAGLDESPQAYKNIDEVMRAQQDLVRAIGKFTPRLVKMAADGEKPED